VCRPLLACLAVALTTHAARPEDPPVLVTVVAADGKPIAGAKVWVYAYTGGTEAPKEPTPLAADAAGKLTVPGETGARRSRQLFARDPAGRIGWSWVTAPWDEGDTSGGIEVVLVDTAGRTGRVLTEDGKPVAGAVVTPLSYYATEQPRREPGGPATSISLPEWEQTRLAVKTDTEGRFKLVAPTAGYSVFYRVKADGFGESKWSATGGVELDTKLARPGTVAIAVAGVDPAALKGCEWRLGAPDDAPERGAGVRAARWQSGTFDGTAKLTVPDVVPGRYELRVWTSGRAPAVFEKTESFEVESGKAAAITAKFGPAAKVTGKIVDKATGKGIAGVRVNVNVSDANSPYAREQHFVETDKDGNYTAHGSAGWYSVWLQTPPAGYATPPQTARFRLVEPVKVEVGKAHTFAAIELPKTVTFTGRVVFRDGKPGAGAVISVGTGPFQNHGKVTADKDGNFTLKNVPPDDAVAPRVRLGKAVNVPETFELEKATRPVSIEISEENAAGFRGRVTDAKGKPVAGAKVALRQMIWGVGRNAGSGSYAGPATSITDADGRYSFVGLWPRDQYRVHVTANGYAPAEAKDLVSEAGEVREFAAVKLTRTSLSVTGTMVGPDGKPVAGAEVFGVDGPGRFSTTSAADGSFTLTGFFDGAAFVFVKKPEYRLSAVPVTPGSKDRVTVTLAKADSPPPAPPEVSPEHRAALDKFTRHALTLVWESHATFGYGGNALEDMARIDLTAAKKWRDEEKARTNGKTDFTRLIDRVVREKTLADTAKEDIDEALAVIGALKADDGFAEAIRLGERMLAVDKAKAARLAEEAVVKARQREIPAKVWSLAEAGDLAARAGNAAGGKKVLLEAAELAGKLGTDDRGRNTLAVGLVAARLAPYDWPKAENLLDSVKDAGEYNRYLSAAAARLAAADLAKAKELLDRFKPSNSFYPHEARLRIAFVIAQEKPDEAVKLIDGVEKGPYRFQGYVRLAAIFTPADKARAAKLIETAFDLLDRDPEAFRSWSNFGGRAGLAAVGTVRAKEIGYPDVAGLVARTLALRATGQDAWSPDDRENNLVSVAAVLARVDPATARHVLAGVAPPDEFIERAMSQRRDWLFALALADPERATKLADKLIERAKNARGGRNALSVTGLVELGSILTAADRLKALTMYGNLPREIGDDD
jgi:uncharacterized GH25 family protein